MSIYPNRRANRYDKWVAEATKTQLREIAKLDDEWGPEHQLRTMLKGKEVETGDIFILQPYDDEFYWGRVLQANIQTKYKKELIEGSHLIVIFRGRIQNFDFTNHEFNYNELLEEPVRLHTFYWKKGWLMTLGNLPLTEQEKELDYGLYSLVSYSYTKADETPLHHEPKIIGGGGILTDIGLGSQIKKRMIFHPHYRTEFMGEQLSAPSSFTPLDVKLMTFRKTKKMEVGHQFIIGLERGIYLAAMIVAVEEQKVVVAFYDKVFTNIDSIDCKDLPVWRVFSLHPSLWTDGFTKRIGKGTMTDAVEVPAAVFRPVLLGYVAAQYAEVNGYEVRKERPVFVPEPPPKRKDVLFQVTIDFSEELEEIRCDATHYRYEMEDELSALIDEKEWGEWINGGTYDETWIVESEFSLNNASIVPKLIKAIEKLKYPGLYSYWVWSDDKQEYERYGVS